MALIKASRKVLELLVASLLISLMALTFVDVVGRYFLSQPVPGGHVLVQCLVCMLVFTGLPLVVLNDDYLRVRILDEHMSARMLKWRDRAVALIVIVILLVLTAQMFWQGGYFAENGEYFESIRIPLSWMAWYAAAATAVAACYAISRFVTGAGEGES